MSRKIVLLIFILALCASISLLYITRTQKDTSFKGTPLNTDSVFADPSGRRIPLEAKFIPGDMLSITGVYQESNIQQTGEITIALPLKTVPDKYLIVTTMLPDQRDSVAALILMKGKYEPIQKWSGIIYDDFISSVSPGDIITVYVNQDQESSNVIVNDWISLTNSKHVAVGTVHKIIYGKH